MVILGIDPGLNATGFGAIDAEKRNLRLIAAGDVRPARNKPLPQRLQQLHEALTRLVSRQKPDTIVLEMVFSHQDYVGTAARMAHARGVACLVAEQQGVSLVEYPTARVKKAITGQGAADKEQVARMVARWLGASDPSWSYDATDALALAIAHAHMQGESLTGGIRNPELAALIRRKRR